MNADRLLAFKPPRIAMGLSLIAFVAHILHPAPLLSLPPLPAALVAAAGFAIMMRAWWLFRRAETPICPTATPHAMLTEDIYSLTRNPMYLGMILMLSALALYFGTVPFIVAAVVYAVVLDRIFCDYEERKMMQLFGARYEAYRRKVRRWL
jgi:protein-S-isoprenylcysteine O-methyltransferase Ste14